MLLSDVVSETLNHLLSSYFTANDGKEPPQTSWKFGPKKESKYTIDYIWYTFQQLQVKAVWGIPSEEAIGENALPGWPRCPMCLF